MAPLFLKSEDALLAHLKKFLIQKPKAVQLDGALASTPNKSVVVVFDHSLSDDKYKLLGDTTRQSIELFVKLAEEHGSAGNVLLAQDDTLVIAAKSKAASGWHCALFVEKSVDSFRKAA